MAVVCDNKYSRRLRQNGCVAGAMLGFQSYLNMT